ncbi:MAG: monooxygenase, partial [Planctomycetia bacterium]|nr:monooxygenase [Planctomycetia bacterium]
MADQALAAGIDAECLEREDGVGGNWNYGAASSRVFASTRLISSKSLTAFTDYPMPRNWPHYPDHRQCLEYLRDYVRHFGLAAHVRHGAAVERIAPAAQSTGWVVHCAGHDTRSYAGVVIASGHNHVPRPAAGSDAFAGPVLHSADYKSPTGCDIAVECSRHAALTVLSTRRGYHVVPREILGRPADLRGERLLKLGLPVWLRRIISLRAMHRAIGSPEGHGLPRPDHRLWETHPIVNSELLDRIAAGAIV